MKKVAYAIVIAVFSFVGGIVGDVPPGSVPEAVAVRNPSQLQMAVRSGVTHIVIAEHLDMTTTPRFSETTIMDAGMLAIVPNEFGQYTQTIRVRSYLQRAACHEYD